MAGISPGGQEQMAVIFDMDGVLVDSYRLHFQSWLYLAEECGLTITKAEFASFFGRTNDDIIPSIWGPDISEEQVAQMDTRKEVLYRQLLQKNVPLMDGARELIDELSEAGFALAVGSSGPPQNVELTLEGLGRAEFFRVRITGQDVTHGKPNPEVFLLAARRIGVQPSRCAVIEDAPDGISAALAGGMTAIALVGTVPAEKLGHANLVVDSLRNLNSGCISRLILAQLESG